MPYPIIDGAPNVPGDFGVDVDGFTEDDSLGEGAEGYLPDVLLDWDDETE